MAAQSSHLTGRRGADLAGEQKLRATLCPLLLQIQSIDREEPMAGPVLRHTRPQR